LNVLILSPEPPYPLNGGGAYRTASLAHYFAGLGDVDLLLLSDSGQPALLPAGLVRNQAVIPLPLHSRAAAARYARNARRAIVGIPPLIDRLSGLEDPIRKAIGHRRYDVGIIEHFWAAPYVELLREVCSTTVLDLHNVESVLHERCAGNGGGLIATGLIGAGHRRFGKMARKLEAELLPRFSLVLAASETDRRQVCEIAPAAKAAVYPNALPWINPYETNPHESQDKIAEPVIVFSGNFEYHPNVDAVRFLVRDIWPRIRARYPGSRLRLVGRGEGHIGHLLPGGMGIETTGPVENALREIARATLVVAPLRMGSGTRIKIIEAWAAGRAVVATPLAAEGLAVQDGTNSVLASRSEQIASAVERLLADPAARQRIGAAGRLTYEKHYTWEAAWRSLDMNLQVLLSPELKRGT